LRRRLARLEALQALTAGLARQRTLPQVAEYVLTTGLTETGGSTGSLCLLSAEGDALEIVYECGYGGDVDDAWHTFPVAAPLPASEAVRTGRPVVVKDAPETCSAADADEWSDDATSLADDPDLRAAGPGADGVQWTIDGKPYTAERWVLVPGDHVVEAVSARRDTVKVRISVER